MELRSVFNYLEGHYKAEEMRLRSTWEQTRWQTAALLNVYAKKGQKIAPKDLVRFPWEKETVNGVDKAALMAMAEKRWAKWDAEMKQ